MVTKNHLKIVRLVMETELQAKHQTKKKIKRQIKRLTFKLKNIVNTIIFNTIVFSYYIQAEYYN